MTRDNKQIDPTGGGVAFLSAQMSEQAACRSFASLYIDPAFVADVRKISAKF
jgi:hypothetical protein